MRWLITGGCGFIGRNFISNLVSEGGHYIRVLDNLKVGSREDLAKVCCFQEIDPANLDKKINTTKEAVELVVGDILDAKLSMNICKGLDIIVHLAANTGVTPSVINPRMDCQTNVIGTINYLEAARYCNVIKFIFASSGAPTGEVEPPIHEELPPHPVSPYGASKLAGEGYCSAYYRTFGVETVCLRFGNVYGPLSGKKNSVIAKFIKQAMSRDTLKIYGDGTQTRDFIYVKDLVEAIYVAALKSDIGGEIFQIATKQETTISEMVKQLVPILNQNGFENFRVTHVNSRKGDMRRNFSDTSKARNVLGWHYATELEDGLKKTVQWFINEK